MRIGLCYAALVGLSVLGVACDGNPTSATKVVATAPAPTQSLADTALTPAEIVYKVVSGQRVYNDCWVRFIQSQCPNGQCDNRWGQIALQDQFCIGFAREKSVPQEPNFTPNPPYQVHVFNTGCEGLGCEEHPTPGAVTVQSAESEAFLACIKAYGRFIPLDARQVCEDKTNYHP